MKKKHLIAILASILIAMVIVVPLLLSGGAVGTDDTESNLQRYKQSVKFVLHTDSNGTPLSIGTAFVINGEGNLITNAHVVCKKQGESLAPHTEDDYIYLIYEKKRRNRDVVVMQRARVQDYDRSRDLALLKVSDMSDRAEFKPLAIASNFSEGQKVTALGYPASIDTYDRDANLAKFIQRLVFYVIKEKKATEIPTNRVELDSDVHMANLLNCVSTDGAISQCRNSTSLGTGTAREASLDVIVHTATLQAGMSGGPLINKRGQVVGVNYGGLAETNNSAIASNELLSFMQPRGGSLDEVVIIDKNPDSLAFTLRTKINNAEPHEIVITLLCSVVIAGAMLTVLMVVLRGKRGRGRRHVPRTNTNSRPNGWTGGNDNKTKRFDDKPDPHVRPVIDEPAHTIPMGRTPGLLFTGIDPKGKALRYRVPFPELMAKRNIRIGRGEGCAIRIDSEYKEVSRQHATIMYEEDAQGNGYLYIRDEQATNPTLINGVALREKCLLMDGDELTIATIKLTFKLD